MIMFKCFEKGLAFKIIEGNIITLAAGFDTDERRIGLVVGYHRTGH